MPNTLRLDKEGGVWVREWDVKSCYTISIAAGILGRSVPQVSEMVGSGDLVGPGSTVDAPVDHGKLAEAAAVVGWRARRSDLRAEVERLLKEVFHT